MAPPGSAELRRVLAQRASGGEVTGRLDNAGTAGHPSHMSESPYAIPADDLFDSAQVPVAEQFVEQPQRRFFAPDAGGDGLFGEAFGGDADGE